jgi:hypothetical protein
MRGSNMGDEPKTKRRKEQLPLRDRIYCSVSQGQEATSLGKTKFFALLKAGRIKSVLVDGRRLVVVSSLLELGKPQESATP